MVYVIIFGVNFITIILLCWLSKAIPDRNIIENLYQFREPLTFTFKDVNFTVSRRELYSDYNVCITEVLINDEAVLKAYKLEKLFTKHRYISYSSDRSQTEVQEILKYARKVYSKNLSKQCEQKLQLKSYFKGEGFQYERND